MLTPNENTPASTCTEECTAMNTSNKGTKRDNASYKHNPFKSKTCIYFSYYGYCKFGNACKYSHHRKRTENRKYAVESSSKQSALPKALPENVVLNSESISTDFVLREPNQKIFQQPYNLRKEHREDENCDLFNVDEFSNNISPTFNSFRNQNASKKIYSRGSRSSEKKFVPVCYYFKKGLCIKGDNCKYFHQSKNILKCENSSSMSTEKGDNISVLSSELQTVLSFKNAALDKPIIINKTSYDLPSLTQDELSVLRINEINQLKKRFPHQEIIEENRTFSVMFQPSDPDWPFDIRNLKLEVDFPISYPLEKCKIAVLQDAENIPELLIRHLNKAIYDWIDRKLEENKISNKTELIFRPFLKWFDKNVEELFITGLRKVKQDFKAKEDGIEFIPAENLFSSKEKSTLDDTAQENNSEVNFQQLQEKTVISDKRSLPIIDESSQYSSNQGLKLVFSELELIEGAAALICTKISVTLQCSRCKTPFSMQSIPKKSNSHVCIKCSKHLGFIFEPSMVHQFSSVLGNLHLLDCVTIDVNLIECHFLVDCLNCSKQVPVDGIHYGQKHKMWCIFCNEKMLLTIGSIKFQASNLASVPAAKYLPAKNIEKKVKDPVVKEGEPLPNFGACKHYKKSYRWLRFPCCGRLYPCDECHNETETDHEMKYASRMICGFCAKEQPYSTEKPCLLCSQSLTKKSGSHWEGGKGCRNKIQMSRDDKQKYAGVYKTVSKKAQNAKPKKKH